MQLTDMLHLLLETILFSGNLLLHPGQRFGGVLIVNLFQLLRGVALRLVQASHQNLLFDILLFLILARLVTRADDTTRARVADVGIGC